MSASSARLVAPLLLAAALSGAAGCEEEESFTDRSKAFGTAPGATSAPSVGPSTDTKAGKAASAELAKLAATPKAPAGPPGKKKVAPARVYTDLELEAIAAYEVTPEPPMDEAFFAEAVDNRDPFRPFQAEALDLGSEGADKGPKADCVLSSYSVDELKLAGIISGIAVPRATFIDPSGTGWTVKKGDCLGRTGGRVARMGGDEVLIVEVSPASGVTVERRIKLHPGAIDLRKALKGSDPTALRGPEPMPEADDSLGVVPGVLGAAPAGPKPKLEEGMSKANFLKHYGKCFAKRTGLGATSSAEVYGVSSTAGECVELERMGGRLLVIIDKGRVTSIQAM